MSVHEINRVVIVPHAGKPGVGAMCQEVVAWLSKHQIRAVLPSPEAQIIGQKELGCSEDELMNGADLIVTLGGDGTILRASRLLEGKETPMLGVNMGTFGFLAEVERSAVLEALAKVVAGDFEIENRMMLSCTIGSGASEVTRNALNEIFVGRGNGQRVTEFDVKVNGRLFGRISCDGLIFATPTGSTAYALSANGPLVSPKNRVIVFVPVCPHSLFNRSLVLEESEKIEIVRSGKHRNSSITIDGVEMWKNRPFDYVRVTAAKASVNLVKFGKRDFFAILRDKLKLFSAADNQESEEEDTCS